MGNCLVVTMESKAEDLRSSTKTFNHPDCSCGPRGLFFGFECFSAFKIALSKQGQTSGGVAALSSSSKTDFGQNAPELCVSLSDRQAAHNDTMDHEVRSQRVTKNTKNRLALMSKAVMSSNDTNYSSCVHC